MHIEESITLSELSLIQQGLALSPVALTLAHAHGFLTAIASSPKITPPSIWLTLLLGPEKNQELVRALFNLYLLILSKLQAKTCFAIYPNDLSAWCQGYLAWINQDKNHWLHQHGEKELDRLLHPILTLASSYEQYTSLDENKNTSLAHYTKLYKQASQQIAASIVNIYAFWQRHQHCNHHQHTPITHAKTISRNDPCHCGSGKKYKKCCGISG